MEKNLEDQDLKMGERTQICRSTSRYPFCVVWTPIPLISWIFPFIGHMGICTSSGIIRDFAGSHFVSEDNMAFGKPTKYWQLDPGKVRSSNWDTAVSSAAEVYKTRVHNLCCDNCHSMVALALNTMQYDGRTSWNMVNLAFYSLFFSKYVSCYGFLKTYVPSLIIFCTVLAFLFYSKL